MTKPLDPLLQSALQTFVEQAFGKRAIRRDIALLETLRGIDKWCISSISHMEIAFSDETTTEARFLRTSREFSDFIHGSLAIYLEQVAIPPFWIVHRKLTLGNYSAVHEAVNAQQGLEALETIVSVLLILNNGHAWVYVNEDGNVYLSHAVAQAL